MNIYTLLPPIRLHLFNTSWMGGCAVCCVTSLCVTMRSPLLRWVVTALHIRDTVIQAPMHISRIPRYPGTAGSDRTHGTAHGKTGLNRGEIRLKLIRLKRPFLALVWGFDIQTAWRESRQHDISPPGELDHINLPERLIGLTHRLSLCEFATGASSVDKYVTRFWKNYCVDVWSTGGTSIGFNSDGFDPEKEASHLTPRPKGFLNRDG
ncbi:hypothetical protein EDD36DRAFT_313084 [Exophiala viscosa]|uniref:Uncharacterized protein n=1 Tax=Exophiala viscosa TaxID=2486360 RepID=A0AAN6DS86_9EURO|nr:hypothetical protein EDD36DRAFT_313084 [Exophiala viscosa]